MIHDDWLTGYQATLDLNEDPDALIFLQQYDELRLHLDELQVCDQTPHAYEA